MCTLLSYRQFFLVEKVFVTWARLLFRGRLCWLEGCDIWCIVVLVWLGWMDMKEYMLVLVLVQGGIYLISTIFTQNDRSIFSFCIITHRHLVAR